MKTVQQFVRNVRWGDLEVLLIDLPPGTGDAQLSLVQTLPLDGAVLVTTPQVAATNVARRGGLMFRKVNVPLLGVAENMSYFIDSVGQRHDLFGTGAEACSPRRSIPSCWARCRCFLKSGWAVIPACPVGGKRPLRRGGTSLSPDGAEFA